MVKAIADVSTGYIHRESKSIYAGEVIIL